MQTYVSPEADRAKAKAQGGTNSPGPVYRLDVSAHHENAVSAHGFLLTVTASYMSVNAHAQQKHCRRRWGGSSCPPAPPQAKCRLAQHGGRAWPRKASLLAQVKQAFGPVL